MHPTVTETTHLQRAVRAAIERTGEPRDALDKRLQQILGTKGKPLWDIERGKSKNPNVATLRALSQVLGEPVSYFSPGLTLGVEPAPRPSRPVPSDDDVVEITALDLSLSMGPGTLIEEFVESEPIKMSLSLVQSITRTPSDRLRLVRGIGDSMEPTLRSSDRVMVDINEKQITRISGIYWINREGAHGIKRLRPAGKGRLTVISDNPVEDNYDVDADEIRIEGRVIWYAREL